MKIFFEKSNFNFVRAKIFNNVLDELNMNLFKDADSFYDAVMTGDAKLISNQSKIISEKTADDLMFDTFTINLADKFASVSDPLDYINSTSASIEALIGRIKKMKMDYEDSQTFVNNKLINETNLEKIENSLINIAFASSIIGECENTRKIIM